MTERSHQALICDTRFILKAERLVFDPFFKAVQSEVFVSAAVFREEIVTKGR